MAAIGSALTAGHLEKRNAARPQVTLLPLSFGASLWLGMPSLRSCSVGPPPSAIHSRGRLTRHPCRVAHCAEPALGLSMGQEDQKPKRGGLPAGLIVRLYTPPCRSCGAAIRLASDGATPANPATPDTPSSLASQLLQKSKKQKAKSKSGVHPCSSPLIRPSVSSPAALDLDSPAPSEG
jgi:hypothetical protein